MVAVKQNYHNPVSLARGLPPTPPMQSEASSYYDGRNSSPAPSPYSGGVATATASAPSNHYYGSSINNLEPHQQRQQAPPPLVRKTSYAGSYPHYSPQSSSYYSSPMQPTPPQQQVSGLYHQQLLPQVRLLKTPAIIHVATSKTNETSPCKKPANTFIVIPSPIATTLCFASTELWDKSLAAPPLHLAISQRTVSAISGPLHLSNMQQSILETQ